MANLNRNSRVSDQIMDYYLRYGQNRDLEKFLRLRSSTTRSSSDGSLPALDELDRREQVAEKIGKSMENLSTLGQQKDRQFAQKSEQSKESEKTNPDTETQQSDHTDKNSSEKTKQQENRPTVGMVVKETKNEKKSGRNFNFNLESVIEIKLPSETVTHNPFLLAAPPGNVPAMETRSRFQEINSSGTQTMPEARSVEQQTEEPIRPILKATGAPAAEAANPEDTIDTTRDISPVSSIASNKQKLEWDSLGDIGYDSSEKFYFCGASDLNETMKRCLQRYLVKRGLNCDEKVVVVRNVQKAAENTDPGQEIRKPNVREKWQAVYRKYKDKYHNPSELSINLANPEAQSTPKITSSQSIPSKPGVSTQTSLIKAFTKAIQAEQIVTADKQIGTESLRGTERRVSSSSAANVTPSVLEDASNEQQGETAESFEFYSSPPSQQVNQSSAESTLKTSPEIISITTSSSKSSSSVSINASGANKHAKYNFEEELRLGMTLYNTICESRSLPARVKQSLIDKIFRKMVKNDPKGRTKEQLLKNCENFKQPDRAAVNVVEAKVSEANCAESSERAIEVLHIKRTAGQVQPSDEQTEPEVVSKEDVIVHDLDEPSTRSNEGGNSFGSKKAQQYYSLSSESPQTSSSKQESNRTAKPKLSTKIDESTIKSSRSGLETDSDRRIGRAMREFLKPMTHSEVDYENQRDLRRSLEVNKKNRAIDRNTASAPTTISSSGLQVNRIIELFRKEKQSQLLKIDKKMEHLQTMKNLLLEDQKLVNDMQDGTQTTYPIEKRFVKPVRSPSEEKENFYANTAQRTKSAASAPVYTSVHGDTPSDLSRSEIEYIPIARSESGWNSHYHMQAMLQNRSKLETPTSDESIATFIKNRKQKFIENYERHRKQMFEDQHHIYTKPYSGRQSKQENYSRLDAKYNVQKITKPPFTKPNFPSSDMFISSDSMSIPAANTLTNTTTHQYDIKSSRSGSDNLLEAIRKPVATQTTSSILRTKPIFETKSNGLKASSAPVPVSSDIVRGCQCTGECPCRHISKTAFSHLPKHTAIIDDRHQKHDKQQQTKPNSIAYVITFQGDRHEKRKSSSQKPSEKEQVYRQGTPATDTEGTSRDSTGNRSGSVSRASEDTDLLPLEEQLRRNRPATLNRLKERQQCVNELNKLRVERNKQRKKLLLLTSDDSLKRNDIRQRLPPPPLAQRRIFSSKAIRENTRRQVKNLPEVLRRKEIEKINNLKRKNLILRDKFNRNLQRKVLHGQIDLSNSVRVIQD
ncbi:centrosome-associated protein Alms1a-like [Wyeomyia smithii]|uniref:centrosome-associated protein Alms1a-like n=1 Tax=Wyeomyia smithii TaxID=174621 RepID=UPI002467AF93|nr:centrosome-associated protein Alms1a-like [Wyeomyia smithii]